MNLLPIAEKLELAGLGVRAKTIFVHTIPMEAPAGILLRNKMSGVPINYELPGYFRGQFQVIVRSKSYVDAEALMNSVTNALYLVDQSLGATHYKYMRAQTMPIVFQLSKGNLVEFSVDMDVAFTQ